MLSASLMIRAAIAVLEGEAPKNAPTFIGTSVVVAQKVCYMKSQ